MSALEDRFPGRHGEGMARLPPEVHDAFGALDWKLPSTDAQIASAEKWAANSELTLPASLEELKKEDTRAHEPLEREAVDKADEAREEATRASLDAEARREFEERMRSGRETGDGRFFER